MKVAKLLALPLLFLLCVPTMALGQGTLPPPTVVVRMNSIDSLIDHVKFLAGLAGEKDAARQIEGLIKTKIGEKGLEGVDSRRPFGFYGRVGKDIEDITAAVLLPIADEKAFLNLLKNLEFQAVKGGDGIYTIKTGFPFDAYLRFANKYAYITAVSMAALEDKNLLDPAKILAGKPTSAFALTIQLDQVPDAAKQLTTSMAEQVLQEAQDKKIPGESPAQKAFRKAAINAVTRLIAAVLKDGKELMTEVELDQKSGDLSATFSHSGKSGSELGTGIEGLAKYPSQYGGFMKTNAAFKGLGHIKLPDPLVKALGDVIDETRTMALEGIQDAAKKQQVETLFSVLSPTLKAGDFDGALLLTSKGKHLTLLTASKVTKGDELGKTIRDLVRASLKDLPPALRENIKLDLDSVGPTKIHKLQLPPAVDPGITMVEAVFGELSFYVAFTNDTMFLSVGKEGLQAIKEAIPVKAAAASPVLFYEIDVARLISVVHPEQADKVRAQFPGGQGSTVRFTVEGGRAVTVRLHTNVAVLRFMGQLHEMKAGRN
jgi:hypothetical protein